MTFAMFKGRLAGAKKGHALLKKKRDALKARFQGMLKDIVVTKQEVGQSLKDAAFSFARANWATPGDISLSVIERAKIPSVTCKLQADNVAGVKLPVFRKQHDPTKDQAVQSLGVACGGAVIQACREVYSKALTAVIALASLQTTFYTLDEEIKMTGRRVNALEYVVIPKIEEVMKYIEQEMDEQAREEFFRIKKVVEKKKQKMVREKAERASEAQVVESALDNDDHDLVY
jgi:V-type H+-transporting ATPase subunit D